MLKNMPHSKTGEPSLRALTERTPQSFGDYLCLSDAADQIGTAKVAGWKRNDLDQIGNSQDASNDIEAWDRAERVETRLTEWVVGGLLPAFGLDDQGAYFELDRTRLSKPYFKLEIARSQFAWAPGEWDAIFIGKSALTQLLNAGVKSSPRKSQIFDWKEVTSLAWELASEYPELRTSPKLIGAVQDRYSETHDNSPDEKELRSLARRIIEFLGDRTLSRDETK